MILYLFGFSENAFRMGKIKTTWQDICKIFAKSFFEGLKNGKILRATKKIIRLIGKILKKEYQQHPVFPGGHPSKYWLSSTLLNFSDRTRTGVFNVIWPLARERGKNPVECIQCCHIDLEFSFPQVENFSCCLAVVFFPDLETWG